MDEITVTLTREQWEVAAKLSREHAASLAAYQESEWRWNRVRSNTKSLETLRSINRAICEQAGLGEDFKCE